MSVKKRSSQNDEGLRLKNSCESNGAVTLLSPANTIQCFSGHVNVKFVQEPVPHFRERGRHAGKINQKV